MAPAALRHSIPSTPVVADLPSWAPTTTSELAPVALGLALLLVGGAALRRSQRSALRAGDGTDGRPGTPPPSGRARGDLDLDPGDDG